MAELSPSSSGSHLRVAPASPLAISNERTDERTTEVSDDRGIPELSDVRARVQDFNTADGQTCDDCQAGRHEDCPIFTCPCTHAWTVTYTHPYPGRFTFTDHAQAIAFAETAIATPPASIHTIPAATGEQPVNEETA